MNLTKPQLIIVGSVFFVVILFALIFLGVLPGLQSKTIDQTKIVATLKVWGVFDSQSDYQQIFDNFKTTYPNVDIAYRSFNDEKDYQETLLDALAAGEGPDIFMIRNSDLSKQANKISPLPTSQFSLVSLRRSFPQIVEKNFVRKRSIYALPLSIDTMVLIYNRDLFNQAGIALAPTTWEEFKAIIPTLTKLDDSQNITQSAAAIGGSNENINTATDLLSLIMLQNKTQFIDERQSAAFASKEGLAAFSFYTQFANPNNVNYTWNDSLPDSLTAFSQEKIAMIFDYAAVLPNIYNQNPFINIIIAPMIQPANADKNITYSNYWGYTVSRQSRNTDLAWSFIINLTVQTNNVQSYIQKTKKPPALNVLINQYADDLELGVFAKQALIAQTWPQIDMQAVNQILSNAIELVNNNRLSIRESLGQAEAQVTKLLRE